MKRYPLIILVALGLTIAVSAALVWRRSAGRDGADSASLLQSISMRIESPDIPMGGPIPADFACDGRDISPALKFTGVPEAAESLAVIMDDPDAPAGVWTHWTVWNIPSGTGVLAQGQVPAGAVQGLTSSGSSGYGGPCPPSGTHRYFFKVYALDALLELGPDADTRELEAAMQGHILDKAGLFGTYAKS